MANLWLTVHEHHWGPGYGFPNELWTKSIHIEGTPSADDRIMMLTDDEEPHGSHLHDIKDRWWDADGLLNLSLRPIVHLPNETWEQDFSSQFRTAVRTGNYRNLTSPWREEDDRHGLLADRLRASGWESYTERLRNRRESQPGASHPAPAAEGDESPRIGLFEPERPSCPDDDQR